MPVDVRTMALMGALVSVLLAVVLFAQYRFNRDYSGVGWWAAGQASVAVGFLVSMLRGDSLVGHIAVPVYQGLLVLGAVFVYVGVALFLDRREWWGWLIIVWGALVCWSTFFTFVVDDSQLRSMALYIALAIILLGAGVTLWRRRIPAVRGSAAFLSIVFIVSAVSYGLLTVFEDLRHHVGNPFYSPSPVNAGAFLTAVTGMLLWTFGFVIMINQRLSADVAREARNMRNVFATGPDCAIISRLSDGVIEDANEGFTTLTGYDRSEAVGRLSSDLGLWVDPAQRDVLVGRIRDHGSVADFPLVLRRKDGQTVECTSSANLLMLDDEPYLITVTRDVTIQRQAEAVLLQEANTDSLTGLANRRRFLHVCERELRRALRNGTPLAIAVVDIDHFKDINDAHGHASGDAAVIAFARALAAGVRDVDTVGRLGGDEFGVLLPEADLDRGVAALERVRLHLSVRPVPLGDASVTVAFSAGVAVAVGEHDTVDTLLARADAALYVAKEQGRNRVVGD